MPLCQPADISFDYLFTSVERDLGTPQSLGSLQRRRLRPQAGGGCSPTHRPRSNPPGRAPAGLCASSWFAPRAVSLLPRGPGHDPPHRRQPRAARSPISPPSPSQVRLMGAPQSMSASCVRKASMSATHHRQVACGNNSRERQLAPRCIGRDAIGISPPPNSAWTLELASGPGREVLSNPFAGKGLYRLADGASRPSRLYCLIGHFESLILGSQGKLGFIGSSMPILAA